MHVNTNVCTGNDKYIKCRGGHNTNVSKGHIQLCCGVFDLAKKKKLKFFLPDDRFDENGHSKDGGFDRTL